MEGGAKRNGGREEKGMERDRKGRVKGTEEEEGRGREREGEGGMGSMGTSPSFPETGSFSEPRAESELASLFQRSPVSAW